MARVEFIQVLLKSPLQVQSFHRGTGHLLDQLIQWRQLQRQDLSQCSDFGETGFLRIYIHNPTRTKGKGTLAFTIAAPVVHMSQDFQYSPQSKKEPNSTQAAASFSYAPMIKQ